MAIKQKKFDNEEELHNWVEENIKEFFGDVVYLKGNFSIKTKRNKGAKPDGFILDFYNSSWSILESELLKHGVWDHIAEQIVRFIVAVRNDITRRKIRDYFFNELEKKSSITKIAKDSNIPESRIIQKIENILETTTPDIIIFINDTNEDLEDMLEALNATVRVFKVQKYEVNGVLEYLCPEGRKSIIETTIEDVEGLQGKPIEALEILGGGKFLSQVGRIKFYLLDNGEKITLKYSKYYEDEPNYWYGITPKALEKYDEQGVKQICFIVGKEGVVKLPIGLLKEYILGTSKSVNPDNSVRHYHIQFKTHPKLLLYNSEKEWEVDDFLFVDEG